MTTPLNHFSLSQRVALVTGGGGVLGGRMAEALALAGARVAVLGRTRSSLQERVQSIQDRGGEAMALCADVLDQGSLEKARETLKNGWGRLDILVNAAGGNKAGATVGPEASLFELSLPDFQGVLNLNLTGTVGPCVVFGEMLKEAPAASIINISSMAADRPLTRVIGYSAAKAGVDNVTRWLAVEFAKRFGERVRVNAIAPGFFLADQNRALLTREDGQLTERGQCIIDHTPMGRFGDPEDLDGAVLWLASDASRFVTGTVIRVDGGFSAFSGV